MQAHQQNAADALILHLKPAQPRWKLLGKSPTVENWCGIIFIQRSRHAFSSKLQKNAQDDRGGSLFFRLDASRILGALFVAHPSS